MSDIYLDQLSYYKNEIDTQRADDLIVEDAKLADKMDKSEKGSAGGIAPLDSAGEVPTGYLPVSVLSEAEDPANNNTVITPEMLHLVLQSLSTGGGYVTKTFLEGKYYDKTVVDGLLRGVVNQFTGTGDPDALLGNVGDTYTETVSGTTVTQTVFEGDSYHSWDNTYDSYTLNSGNPWISIDIANLNLSMIAQNGTVIPTMSSAKLILANMPVMALTVSGETSSHVAGSIKAADGSITDSALKSQLRALNGNPHFKITAEVTTGGTTTVHWEKTSHGWIKTPTSSHDEVYNGTEVGSYTVQSADNVPVSAGMAYILVLSEDLPEGLYEAGVSFLTTNLVGDYEAKYDIEGGNSFKAMSHGPNGLSHRIIMEHRPTGGHGILEIQLQVTADGSLTLEDVVITAEKKGA